MKKMRLCMITTAMTMAFMLLPAMHFSVFGQETGETAPEDALVLEEAPVSEEDTVSDTETDLARSVSDAAISLNLKEGTLQFGGLLCEKEKNDTGLSASRGSADIDAVLTDAVRGMNTSVDVGSYQITADQIKDSVIDVINANPSFFYVEGVDVSCKEGSSVVSRVEFDYSQDAARASSKYDKEVAKILSGIDDSWPDEKKLMYIHDYLVTHTQYDLSLSRYSAYDVIVDHSGVCQAYALAFEDLAKKAGFWAGLVSSGQLDHAWNIVKVGGKKYYVDVTWDDPITYGPSREDAHCYRMHCEHKDFLGSYDKMVELNHTSKDWYSDGEYITGKYNNKKYDDAPWRNAYDSQVIFLDAGKILYCFDGHTFHPYLAEYDLKNSKERKIMDLEDLDKGARTMTMLSGHIFINDATSIYIFDTVNEKLLIYHTMSSSEKAKGFIYGIDGEGSKIRYDIATGDNSVEYVKSGYVDISNIDAVNSISLSTEDIAFAAAGETQKITATISPADADKIKWISTDPNVATVDNGVVTAVSRGRSLICAFAGQKVAECYVSVGGTLRINKNHLDLYEGDTEQLTAKYVNHVPTWINSVVWESDDPSIASVSETGLVTAQKPGKTTIYAADWGILYHYCTVTVRSLKPDKPTILSVENTGKGLSIAWNPSYGAMGYDLYKKSGGKYSKIATVTGTSYTDKKASQNGKKYSYKVLAFKTVNGKTYKSSKSDSASCYSVASSKLKSVKNTGKRTVMLKWAKNPKCSGYEIEYATDKNFKNAKTATESSAKTTSCEIKGLKKKKTYYFRIRPFKKKDGVCYFGSWSKAQKVKIKK